MYQWKGEDAIFGGEQFQTEDSLFDSVSSWMDTFEVPYILEDPNDKYSDEHEINNQLTDKYEIKNKPEENKWIIVKDKDGREFKYHQWTGYCYYAYVLDADGCDGWRSDIDIVTWRYDYSI